MVAIEVREENAAAEREREEDAAYLAGEGPLRISKGDNQAAGLSAEEFLITLKDDSLRASHTATRDAIAHGSSRTPEGVLDLMELRTGLAVLNKEMNRRGIVPAPAATKAMNAPRQAARGREI